MDQTAGVGTRPTSPSVTSIARWVAIAVAVLAVSAWDSSVVRAQVPSVESDTRAARVDALFTTHAGHSLPGCTVGVQQDDTLVYQRSFGLADLEHGVPLGASSVFDVASVSKQFTAFAIAVLERDGRLSLEDDVRTYIPELPDYGRPITLAHLLHHTNGLRENYYLLGLAGWRVDDIYTEADRLWAIVSQERVNFAAGDEVVYSNSAYDLLREVVQRVSGTSLEAFAEARIFRPLGMRDTRFGHDHREVVPRRARGYVSGTAGPWLAVPVTNDAYGPGGLLTTVPDLLKWQLNLIDGRVGGAEVLARVRASGRLNDGTETGYGGGLWVRRYRGLRTVGHEGFTSGFRTDTVLFPDHGLGVVVLCNTSAIPAEELSLKVADIYLGDRMTGPALAPAVTLPAAAQEPLAGTWWSPLADEIVRLAWREGALRQVGSSTPLVPIGEGTFRPGDSRSRWQFVADGGAGGGRELRIFDAWPTYRPFVKLSEPAPDVADLGACAGEYRSRELDTTYVVRVVDGTLRMSWARGHEMDLEPVGGDRFVGSRGTVTFTRSQARTIDGLTISNRRLRRFRVERVPESARSRAEDPVTSRLGEQRRRPR